MMCQCCATFESELTTTHTIREQTVGGKPCGILTIVARRWSCVPDILRSKYVCSHCSGGRSKNVRCRRRGEKLVQRQYRRRGPCRRGGPSHRPSVSGRVDLEATIRFRMRDSAIGA